MSSWCRPSVCIEFPRLIPRTSRVKRKNTAFHYVHGEVGRAQLASERASAEADGLRVEIFRMARTNKESAADWPHPTDFDRPLENVTALSRALVDRRH